MNPELKNQLSALEQFGRENDARDIDRQHKMLNLERDSAVLLHILIGASRRHTILEIGTSNGYSTLWLADAVRADPAARITSVERKSAKVEMARENLMRAGLGDFVNLVHGEASEVCRALPGPYDCVFFDADRTSAPEQLQTLLPKLMPDVLLLCDNVLSHPAEAADYLSMVERLPHFSPVTVPIGKGLHIAYRNVRKA